MTAFRLRDADLARDKPVFVAFIMGSQRYEHAIEPNRRLDPAVGEEYYVTLMQEVAENRGRIFVAEGEAGAVLGWAVAFEQEEPVFVVEAERRTVYISELFVVEDARSAGVGRALIGACEAWARELGIAIVTITLLAANTRADAIYHRTGYADYGKQLRKYLR